MPRWQRIAVTLAVVATGLAVVALVVALLAAGILDTAQGCGSIDPGDPANYSSVVILNDTPTSVSISDCKGSYCSGDATTIDLPSGRSVKVDAACGVRGAQMTSWRVGGTGGRTLGYIAVQSARKHDGLVYPVTAASPDRRTPTPPR